MAFTEFETSTANISGLSDRPNQNDGLSSAQLKGRFDKAGNDIKTYINDVLLEELERTTDGDSGADNIGATAVGDGTATTVQGILEEIDADVTALDGAVVHKTGNETIADVKTFTDSPIVPAPTADTNPATKKYVDDADALKVDISDIVNDLTTGGTAVPLSAEQGKTLKGQFNAHKGNTANPHGVTAAQAGAVPTTRTVNSKPLSSDITLSASDVGALSTTDAGDLAELTTTEKGSLVGAINELDTDKVETSAIVNTLTETEEGKVLDARQGKTLSDKIGTQTYTENNYITDAEPLTASIDKLDMQAKDTADSIGTHTGATNPHGITKTTVGLDNVDNVKQATTTTYTTTLDTTWSGTEAPYTKEQTVTGILSTDNPIVDIVLSGTYATDSKIEADWAEIYRIVTSANSVTFYAHKKPTNSIPLQFKVVR